VTVVDQLRAVGVQSALFNGSWRASIGTVPKNLAISASGDRAIAPWVKTESYEIPPRQLTAGSDLNVTAEGPWPYIIDASVLTYDSGTAWRPSTLREIFNHNVGGNYGSVTSLANFNFRNAAFGAYQAGKMGVIGLLPNTMPNPKRPMWNNLPSAQYNLRVPSSSRVPIDQNTNYENINAYSLSFQQTGSASLNTTGAPQTEVLL
jgi:hypothetical protein